MSKVCSKECVSKVCSKECVSKVCSKECVSKGDTGHNRQDAGHRMVERNQE